MSRSECFRYPNIRKQTSRCNRHPFSYGSQMLSRLKRLHFCPPQAYGQAQRMLKPACMSVVLADLWSFNARKPDMVTLLTPPACYDTFLPGFQLSQNCAVSVQKRSTLLSRADVQASQAPMLSHRDAVLPWNSRPPLPALPTPSAMAYPCHSFGAVQSKGHEIVKGCQVWYMTLPSNPPSPFLLSRG